MIRALIVDDEMHCRENLEMLVKEYCPQVEILGSAADVISASQIINEDQPDLVFLDIMMPKNDGFSLLNEFADREFAVVFITAHSEFALKAMRNEAVDYLQKPIDIEELKSAVARVEKRLEKQSDSQNVEDTVRKVLGEMGLGEERHNLSIPTTDGLDLVKHQDIVRLEANESYTVLYLSNGKKYLSSKNIKVFEDHLPEALFMRVHKSHIINISHHLNAFSRTGGNIALLSSGEEIPISRRKLQVFLERIQSF